MNAIKPKHFTFETTESKKEEHPTVLQEIGITPRLLSKSSIEIMKALSIPEDEENFDPEKSISQFLTEFSISESSVQCTKKTDGSKEYWVAHTQSGVEFAQGVNKTDACRSALSFLNDVVKAQPSIKHVVTYAPSTYIPKVFQ